MTISGNKLFVVLFLAIFSNVNCSRKLKIDLSKKCNDCNVKFVIDRKELINGKDSIIYGWIYVDDKIDYSLIYNEQGDIEFLAKKDSLGYAKGGYSLSFQNNILIQMKYLDSIGLLQGPLFIYNKRGKLKHLLIYKDDQLYKIIYTRCAKCLNRDTLFINAKPLIREQ